MEVKIWKIPDSERESIERAFAERNYLFLITKWNEYKVTDAKLCSGCPNTIEIIEKYYAKYLKSFQNE